jgi:hypothetical protein
VTDGRINITHIDDAFFLFFDTCIHHAVPCIATRLSGSAAP